MDHGLLGKINPEKMIEKKESNISLLIPYLQITLAGIFAFAPISFFQRSLKNDIIALEFPINQFMSQCIRNGEFPYWFNTWGMGFPLQSNLTWGVFSTPRFFFSSVFNYNIYSLHVELIFFICMAGWTMYSLLMKHFVKDKSLAVLLAISYMLSGFITGSTQWLLYITAAAFIPLVLSSLLSLFNKPSVRTALQLSIVYTLMFTSVYAAFNVISTYFIFFFIIAYLLNTKVDIPQKVKLAKYCFLAVGIILVLCGPTLLATIELMPHIERGSSINNNISFFESNYLHPKGLLSSILPLPSAKMNFANTEGSMLNTYLGIFVMILLPSVFGKLNKENRKTIIALTIFATLFLTTAFGSMTPVRNALNILPGFSFFRNSAIFRLYFIICCILLIATAYKNWNFSEIINHIKKRKTNPIAFTFLFILVMISASTFIALINQQFSLTTKSVKAFLNNSDYFQLLFINSIIQLFLLTTLFIAFKKNKERFIKIILVSELVINTLICTPYYSVSSYTLNEINSICKVSPGFPIQNEPLSETYAVYTDKKGNIWHNTNTYKKQVSVNQSYRGPLSLNSFSNRDDASKHLLVNKKLVFSSSQDTSSVITITKQYPNSVIAEISLPAPADITLMQNYYPGWKAKYNNQSIPFSSTKNGLTVNAPAGKGKIEFQYKRPDIMICSILLHITIISYLIWRVFSYFKRRKN